MPLENSVFGASTLASAKTPPLLNPYYRLHGLPGVKVGPLN